MLTPQGLVVSNIEDEINSAYKLNVDAIKLSLLLIEWFLIHYIHIHGIGLGLDCNFQIKVTCIF